LRAAFASVDGAEHVNAFIDMHDLGDALVHAGFADPVMEMEVITLEYSSVMDVARDLQAIGARNAMPGRPRGLSGRHRWERVVAAYEALRRNGVLPATYEVIYGHAWKVPPKKTADGRQVIDFRPRGAP
jgi:malonyl-CoA O-methyltransferase